jgi:hypothetical protein
LLRTDDAGNTWRQVDLPPDTGKVVVDPSNHTVMYAVQSTLAPNGDRVEGLLKTSDDAQTWQPSVPPMLERPQLHVLELAVSPADSRVLYLALGLNSTFELRRSLDGGATWSTLTSQTVQATCSWGVSLLYPHPTDPRRVFMSETCSAGFTLSQLHFATVGHSFDQGTTWQSVFSPERAFVGPLVGGSGADPARLFLADRPLMALFPGSVYRSDDDGVTWERVFQLDKVPERIQPDFRVLALDPNNPDRLFAGWSCAECGVQASFDGGVSWAPFGRQDTGRVNDVLLGIDGRNVYAATDQGVWRMSLAPQTE